MPSALRNSLLTALLALVFGFLGAATWSWSGLADNRTRAYLLENPVVLEEMFAALQQQQAQERLAEVGSPAYMPFPGAVMGNPEGSKVLVEFTDYNCSYCEASLPDVTRLIAEDPDLKVVLRELPQFDGSEAAARMALAAAMQGKYVEFHEAMFKLGPANSETAVAAAQQIGLDLERARTDAASDVVTVELAKNFQLAQQLGFNGTPGWIVGDTLVNGFVGYDRMKEALEKAGPPLG
ncbi:DsbA family protein [Erythrobacter sp. THAF29]|uniref:DsbA family protein n=1 Tax=Erythrobacter sp. THAF29 TaxID=2587851 RepID=UPI001268B311|nr:DsbA family protein [Erythrobacter sp. THAF29]QFT76447.1 Disulfide bond formation protein D precursor [Erythrobacter sp. THAF29]